MPQKLMDKLLAKAKKLNVPVPKKYEAQPQGWQEIKERVVQAENALKAAKQNAPVPSKKDLKSIGNAFNLSKGDLKK